VALLIVFLFAGLWRINRSLNSATNYSFFCIAMWLIVVIHNFTEASYNTFTPLWIALLFVSTGVPRPSEPPRDPRAEPADDHARISTEAYG
jgi:hypothetical protein